MLMSLMSEDEIRCWVDMIDSGYAPSLYLFRIEDNKVSMHMEILHNGKGFTYTDKFFYAIEKWEPSCVVWYKPLSYFIRGRRFDPNPKQSLL